MRALHSGLNIPKYVLTELWIYLGFYYGKILNKLLFQRNNRIWRKGLTCKLSSVASNQVYNKSDDITK